MGRGHWVFRYFGRVPFAVAMSSAVANGGSGRHESSRREKASEGKRGHREHSHRHDREHKEREHRDRKDRDSHRERHHRSEKHRERRRRHGGGGEDGSSSRHGGSDSRLIHRVTEGGVTVTINADHVLGNGSFGVVFEATIQETGQIVAIKKVLQDKRFKNRELQIMKQLEHCNVCKLLHCFYSSGDKPDEVYLNLVMEFVPETVYKVMKHYLAMKQLPPLICVKLYMYQLFRSLAYTHAVGVCHRDIKPQNLLVDPSQHILKLCDFGSAKQLVKGEPNVSYICSRYYRAPELIFGATDYTVSIDVWSSGCVLAELLVGQPVFPGESGVDQLVEIIKVLGTPTREEIRAMNPSYTEFKFPQIRAHAWNKVIRRAPPAATDLLSRLLVYTPTERLTPLQACAHPFFDELRKPTTRLPNGKPLPPLFNLSELELSGNPELAHILIPEHARNPSNWPPAGVASRSSAAVGTSSIPAVASPPPLTRGHGKTSSRSLPGSGSHGSGAAGGAGDPGRSTERMPAVTGRSAASSKLLPMPEPSRHISSRSHGSSSYLPVQRSGSDRTGSSWNGGGGDRSERKSRRRAERLAERGGGGDSYRGGAFPEEIREAVPTSGHMRGVAGAPSVASGLIGESARLDP